MLYAYSLLWTTAERMFYMKGIVLSLGLPRKKRRLPDLKTIIRRHGTTLLFAALILIGLVLGAVYSKSADKNTLRSLDFLFTTNLESRLSQGAFGTFCACFASDFIFLLAVYLLGIAAWGIPFIAALLCFKGFGTGVTAGWLCVSHGLSGAGFYLLVLLPGTFIFCAALIGFAVRAFAFSKHAFFYSLSRQTPASSLRDDLLRFSLHQSPRLRTRFCGRFLRGLLNSSRFSRHRR